MFVFLKFSVDFAVDHPMGLKELLLAVGTMNRVFPGFTDPSMPAEGAHLSLHSRDTTMALKGLSLVLYLGLMHDEDRSEEEPGGGHALFSGIFWYRKDLDLDWT